MRALSRPAAPAGRATLRAVRRADRLAGRALPRMLRAAHRVVMRLGPKDAEPRRLLKTRGPFLLASDDEALYLGDRRDGSIRRLSKDGGKPRLLASQLENLTTQSLLNHPARQGDLRALPGRRH